MMCHSDWFNKQPGWPIVEQNKFRWEGQTENDFPQYREQDKGQSAVCFPFRATLETLAKANQQEMFLL